MKNTKKILDFLKKFLLIFIIGGLGGVFASKMLMPYLVSLPTFSDIEALKNSIDTTTIINKTENITINEEEGIEKVLSKIDVSLVGIKTYIDEKLQKEVSGIIVTGDGYILTSNIIVEDNVDKIDVIINSETIPAEFIREDKSSSLVILKIDKKDLTPVSFADFEEIKLAEKVMIIGFDLASKTKFVNITNIRSKRENSLQLNCVQETINANGAAVLDLKGDLIGIAIVDIKTSFLTVIPINLIDTLSFNK